MKPERLLLALIAVVLMLTFAGCGGGEDDPEPDDQNGGGKVNITGVSHEYIFWGKELTISGTGFSSVKEENIVSFVNSYPRTPGLKLTSDGGDIEIVSASPTSIKIIVPFETEVKWGTNIYRGEDFAQIEVAVKSEKDTSEMVKFIGLPHVGGFEYHYGWYDLGGVARSGDSVVLFGGFYGSYSGAGEKHPKAAGVYDKLRLSVDGISVPMKWRKISQFTQGYGMYLPAADFSEVNCDDGANGWNDRAMSFKFFVQNTDIENSKTLYVTYLPEHSVTSAEGPTVVSKSLGGNPAWTVKGDDMYYSHAVFATNCQGVSDAEVDISNPGIFKSEYQIGVPLSLMVANCSYTIYLKTACDEMKVIGNVFVNP